MRARDAQCGGRAAQILFGHQPLHTLQVQTLTVQAHAGLLPLHHKVVLTKDQSLRKAHAPITLVEQRFFRQQDALSVINDNVALQTNHSGLATHQAVQLGGNHSVTRITRYRAWRQLRWEQIAAKALAEICCIGFRMLLVKIGRQIRIKTNTYRIRNGIRIFRRHNGSGWQQQG